MKRRLELNRIAQLVVVLACAFAVKLYYSNANANQLRWILAPTASLVELVSSTSFEFESYEGYISSDRSFVIADSCSGVNFLITAFLMLSLRKLIAGPWTRSSWLFIPATAIVAYLATLVANTARVAIALQLKRMPGEVSWLNPGQVHLIEGIVIYFGFLLLLFVVGEILSSQKASGFFRLCLFPLGVYYTTMLGIPMANGAYRQGTEFWEYSLFVLAIPLMLILPMAATRIWRPEKLFRSPPSDGTLESGHFGVKHHSAK